jgi:hypothetical protein
MKFTSLQETIPLVRGGKNHVLSFKPYVGVELRMPGRHQEDTIPKGGDGVVIVDDTDAEWTAHRFKHDDIFNDVSDKSEDDPDRCDVLMEDYYKVIVENKDPDKCEWGSDDFPGTLHPMTFLYATQVLAVIEHRRYAMHEPRGGGRYLPLRMTLGIASGLWTASKAGSVQKYGRPAVERLEAQNGIPDLTVKLLDRL